MLNLGAHMSIAGGVDRALERGASIGCSAIQIFLKNNMQWLGKKFSKTEIVRFHENQKITGMRTVFAHSSYLINLAATNRSFRKRSIESLVDEIERATVLGVPFIVMHPGAHMGAGEVAGLRAVAESLDAAFEATPESKVRIALETTAGQGSSLGCRFEHLAEIFQTCRYPSRLAVCVDTCHVFAAGYDIRTATGYEATMKRLCRLVGRKQVVAFHLNDSKKPLGSRVDRHEHIGKGMLGSAAFRYLLNDKRWDGLPMVLETPKGPDLAEDVVNLRRLRRLCRRSVSALL
jgi:deoxyribonuclease IV